MSEKELPAYVDFGANPRYQAPFTIQGCRMNNFVVAADFEKLRALFSNTLNKPSGGAVDFWPVGLPGFTYVLFSFVDMRHQSAREPTLGWIREQEFTVFVPGFDFNALRNGDRGFAFFIPYIFVDSDAALIVGRETYGFPKRLGSVSLPPAQGAPTFFALDTLVIPGATPDTEAVSRRLIEIHSVGEGKPEDRSVVFRDFESMCKQIADRVFGGPIKITQAEEHLLDIGRELGLGVPLVFLKQLRDTALQDRACYQSIVASSFSLTAFNGGGLLGDYEITLSDFPSDPLREELGLSTGVLRPKLSFHVEYDFIVPPGHELWRANTTP
ncbi:MAG: acetoacetate decarboxylase family protein [Candidatus Binataceae bacterium]